MRDFLVMAVDGRGGRVERPGAADVHAAMGGPGPAVYTAFRTFHHDRFLLLDRHLARLADSARRAGVDTPVDPVAIRATLRAACATWPGEAAKVRVDVRQDPLPGTDARVLVGLWPLVPVPPEALRDGVSLASAPGARRVAPRTKSSDWITSRAAWVGQPAAFEHALLDDAGGLLEGFTSNLWFVRGGVLITAEDDVLHGITRGLLLEVAASQGLPVERRAFPLDEVGTLDEAGLSSASRALVPIVTIDGRAVGDGRPGPVLKRLRAGYAARLEALLEPA
jgi:branched-subunit amino acid aminotransferase/4-amino-4-deoxychorismate lyase